MNKKKSYTKNNQTQKSKYVTKYELEKMTRSKSDLKFCDVTGTSANMTTSGTFISAYTNLSRGTEGLNNFIGNTLTPKGLLLNYCCQTNQNYNFCRCMLVQWFDAGTPAISAILQYTGAGVATVSPTLVTNKQYVKILYDKTFAIAPTAADGGSVLGNGIFCDKVYIPHYRLKETRFNSNTNVVQDGNLFFVFLSDDALTTFPQITYVVRTSFWDM